jgi:hypothetical protein
MKKVIVFPGYSFTLKNEAGIGMEQVLTDEDRKIAPILKDTESVTIYYGNNGHYLAVLITRRPEGLFSWWK